MSFKKSAFIFLAFILTVVTPLTGQHLLSTHGQAIVNENQDTVLLRGMGLGGWMVQEGYMLQTAGFANPQHEIRATIEALIGEEQTDLFYEAWLANHVRKPDIDSLKAWGFNSIRLPMHYNLFTLPIEEEPIPGEHTWLSKGFELTDSVISWCAQNEMYVILDLHAAPGGQGQDAAISDYDPTKPSLWESKDNRDKMVALWKKIAERYADEQWVAGYDLLNEPNWELPGNVLMRELYEETTDSIRSVDSNHIIIIEGNWWANDFTGLTPPWDDNIVYSPHKYWSNNDVGTMQWVLDIRNTYNVPLYLGESGENSNVWFRDAIRLLEDLDIGWAWWPMKKIESISGPLSVVKTEEYQSLLDYWSGNGPAPDPAFAAATLMEIAEGLKAENCILQQDVIDAMFRQVRSDETVPYHQPHTIPGIIHATDFDMGVVGEAYYDKVVANYHVSTGNYTAWNKGWAYRNDGVDIEPCSDTVNANGFNVGFTETGEWMQYESDITESGVYDIHLRVASGGSGGRLHFAADGTAITPTSFMPPTGGWQNWETVVVPNVILDANDLKIRIHIDAAGFNISSFEFVGTALSSVEVPTQFMAAATVDEYTIKMNTNKFMDALLPPAPGEFDLLVDGNSVPIASVTIDPDNRKQFIFTVDYLLKSTEEIRISYNGDSVKAEDGTGLNPFTLEEVKNNLFFVHQLPGRVEAEAFRVQEGVELEETTDEGGGQNIAYLDPGDYLDYDVNVTAPGEYQVSYRTASQFATGGIELQLWDGAGNVSVVQNASFPSTGDWQNWTTTNGIANLPAGRYTLRVLITAAPFNLNWIGFDLNVASSAEEGFTEVATVFPNPSEGLYQLKITGQKAAHVQVFSADGKAVLDRRLHAAPIVTETLSLSGRPNGLYYLLIRFSDGTFYSEKLIKAD